MPLNLKRIRELRKSLKLTQQEAADVAGLAGKQHWSNIESGKQMGITVAQLEGMAKALKCSPCDLLSKPRRK